MRYKGVDSASPVSAAAARKLAELGFSFCGRYLAPAGWKVLTKAEAELIHAAGLSILVVWETTADRAKSGAAGGEQDGLRAYNLAVELGAPAGTTIYYAVDYDAGEGDFDAIEAYLRAAGTASAPYAVGVYGSYRVVEEMRRRGACAACWQCCAWSYGRLSEYADAYQAEWSGTTGAKAVAAQVGFDVDLDEARSLDTFWQPEPVAHWYDEAMAWAKAEGLIRDGRPGDAVTRAELATVLYRLCHGREQQYDPEHDRPSGLLTDD